MSYEKERFVDNVDEELLCSVCGLVFKDPVQIRQCEHCFCKACMREWWKHRQICPIDRTRVPSWDDLIPPARIMRNMLSRLRITCDNEGFGCDVVVQLESLESHVEQCKYNPKRMTPCTKGCGLTIPFNEMDQHNCIERLHSCLRKESERVAHLENRLEELEQQILDQHNDLLSLNELVLTLRSTVPVSISVPSYPDEVERAIQTSQWLVTLRPARIRRWGGMISTPDTVLQSIIQKGLVDINCPSYLVSELMENSHERRWPSGLSTLETRQLNRRRYEQYVTKRIPGKQAILIMSCENEHMGDSMIAPPGMVMIFAHGVE